MGPPGRLRDRSHRGLGGLPPRHLQPAGPCGYTRRVDVFKPVIAAVNGYAFAAGLETALLADIRIGAENAEFGALERRWNIVGGDGLTARLPLVVGFARAMELIITGRRIDVHDAERIGLVNEVVPRGEALARAQELAREIAALPQGAMRADKETVVMGVGRTLEERLRLEAEMVVSMCAATRTRWAPARSSGARRPSGRITACDRQRPRESSSRSASTMSRMSSSKLVRGSQPSRRLALP